MGRGISGWRWMVSKPGDAILGDARPGDGNPGEGNPGESIGKPIVSRAAAVWGSGGIGGRSRSRSGVMLCSVRVPDVLSGETLVDGVPL